MAERRLAKEENPDYIPVYRTGDYSIKPQILKVTQKAKDAVPHIVETFKNINTNITAGISEEELKIFESVLLRMQSNIKPLNTTTT